MRRLIALAAALALALPGAAGAATLVVPKMGLRAQIGSSLDAGPTWWNGVRPGDGMRVSVAGHRTTHSRPFYHLDTLRRGDRIYIRTPARTWAYRVTFVRVFPASKVYRTDLRESLMLSACTPRGSASHRLVVYAVPV